MLPSVQLENRLQLSCCGNLASTRKYSTSNSPSKSGSAPKPVRPRVSAEVDFRVIFVGSSPSRVISGSLSPSSLFLNSSHSRPALVWPLAIAGRSVGHQEGEQCSGQKRRAHDVGVLGNSVLLVRWPPDWVTSGPQACCTSVVLHPLLAASLQPRTSTSPLPSSRPFCTSTLPISLPPLCGPSTFQHT